MVTAGGFQARASVTPIVSVPSPETCCTRISDEFGRDDRGVVRVVVQPVEAEGGPDVESCRPHRFGGAGQDERDQSRIDLYCCPDHDVGSLRACVMAACTSGTRVGSHCLAHGKTAGRLGKLPCNESGHPRNS